jgi:hypothetical protein
MAGDDAPDWILVHSLSLPLNICGGILLGEGAIVNAAQRKALVRRHGIPALFPTWM